VFIKPVIVSYSISYSIALLNLFTRSFYSFFYSAVLNRPGLVGRLKRPVERSRRMPARAGWTKTVESKKAKLGANAASNQKASRLCLACRLRAKVNTFQSAPS
jgi:hypothetical protein